MRSSKTKSPSEPIWLQIKHRRRRKAKLLADAERITAAANIVNAQAYRNYDPRTLSLIAAAPYSAKINVRQDKVILSYDANRAPYITPEFKEYKAYADNLYSEELKEQQKLEEAFKEARKKVTDTYTQLRIRSYRDER